MDEKIKGRGPGRPVKKVPRGKKRIQVSMILSAELKTRLDNVAKHTGRTFSQTGEMLIERALAVDVVLQQTNLSLEGLEAIAREKFEAEMIQRGYRKLRVRPDPRFPRRSFVWVSPELLGERSGFKPWDEGEQLSGEVDVQIEEEPK
jgi:predicted transcriptional regulator